MKGLEKGKGSVVRKSSLEVAELVQRFGMRSGGDENVVR